MESITITQYVPPPAGAAGETVKIYGHPGRVKILRRPLGRTLEADMNAPVSICFVGTSLIYPVKIIGQIEGELYGGVVFENDWGRESLNRLPSHMDAGSW